MNGICYIWISVYMLDEKEYGYLWTICVCVCAFASEHTEFLSCSDLIKKR